jgi:virulence-associated protein VapD
MKSLPLYAGLIFILVSVACTSTSPRFKEEDISKTETDIRTNFEQHGFIVEQVSLIKESDRRLSGYVKMRKAGLFSKIPLTKNCIATMDADSSKYIWECK